MYPEESFAEIGWQAVEAEWKRGQRYKVERGVEGCLAEVGGRVTQWARREEVGELGRGRVGWVCSMHGWGYWLRRIVWEETGEIDEVAEEVLEEKFKD